MDEIGILVRSSRGRSTLASTDKGDIGVICEKGDIESMRVGKPYVEKERGDYGASGRTSGCAWTDCGDGGVGFKQELEQARMVGNAVKIPVGMAARLGNGSSIQSKDRL